VFPATVNDDQSYEIIENAAKECNLTLKFLENPFKWSEDFGYYSDVCKTGFFGLGSGSNQPGLHNPDFDFPDEIIETGVEVFYKIYKKLCFN
jgi:metal-dependent amidase/aminoacylase/carboxypeptidase family protein